MSSRGVALALFATVIAGILLSNTVGDGNALGGVMFFVWAIALVSLIGLGVRALVSRGRG